ncbi:MAG: Crp/Fnr family transcriptional regulator [Gammaproteobacteria bacterium]|nr:Crp/Fnr family transcriptional regulator [Gammaproteobacteria bacterium]
MSHSVELEHILHNHRLFKSLSPDLLRRASLGASIQELAKGEHLFEQGDPADAFYYLIEGQVKLSRLSPEGDEKILEVTTPGSTFAEALMFKRVPIYPVAAQALKKSRLLRVNSVNYYAVLAESPQSCLTLLADLSVRLHALVNEIDKLTLHNAACRIAGYLLTRIPVDGLEYELDIPKLVLASRLAVKPETFSRIIKQLCAEDLIRVKGNHIRILDLQGLRDFSESCAMMEDSLSDSFQLHQQD